MANDATAQNPIITGMLVAAKIAGNYEVGRNNENQHKFDAVAEGIAEAIEAAAVKDLGALLQCEWKCTNTQDWHIAGCNGQHFQIRPLMEYCPYCSRQLKIICS